MFLSELAAVVVVIDFVVVFADVGLSPEAGAASRRGWVLRIEGPDGGAVVGGGRIQPTYDPDSECKGAVDPVFWVVIFVYLVVRWFAPREAVRAVVLLCWNMDKFEVEK